MKTLNLILKIVFMISILEFQNCKQDPCNTANQTPVNETFTISDLNISKISYNGFDTIVFLSDSGKIATFLGQGKNRYYNVGTSFSGLDCPRKITRKYDVIEIKFIDSNFNTAFLNYKVYCTDEALGFTGFLININNTLLSEYNFEYCSNYLIEDSIYFNGKFSYGHYINDNKTILYNRQFGILKFKFLNETWIKTK